MDRPGRSNSREGKRPRSDPNVVSDEHAVTVARTRRDFRRSQPVIGGQTGIRSSQRLRAGQLGPGASSTASSTLKPITLNTRGERIEPDGRRRRSISKETRPSLEIWNGRTSRLESRTNSIYAESHVGTQLPNRPTSTDSSYYERSHSPLPSQSGPSHPYHMYPQAGVGPFSSHASSSTSRSRSSMYTSARPAHPYGMYQQNTLPLDEDEDDVPMVQAPIQVGFPGRNTDYHRQIGPDGEEQYMLGPDGHTEELPPYSKYPEQGSGKLSTRQGATLNDTSVAPQNPTQSQTDNITSTAGPVQAPLSSTPTPVPIPTSTSVPTPTLIPPLGHQGLPDPTPRRPSEAQTSRTIPTSTSVPAPTPIPPLGHQGLPDPTPRRPSEAQTSRSSRTSMAMEKAWNEKTWKERRRTRVCGGSVPVWVIVLAGSIILFVVIVAGGVIGGLLTANREEKEPPTVTVTSTQSMFDASLIPTPTGMPPLPSGQFSLPLGIPQEQQKNCLTTAEQLNAWSCTTPPPPLFLEIHQSQPGFSIMKMWGSALPPLPDGQKPRFNYTYGAQPPRVQPMQRLYWVSDLEEPARGPALHFQTNYDKLVILDPTQFTVGRKSKQKRLPVNSPLPEYLPSPVPGAPPPILPPHGYRHRMETLKTGDQPWFCYWNSTFIEGFVYMKQNSSLRNGINGSSSAPSTTSGSASFPSFVFSESALPVATATPSPQVAAAGSGKKDDIPKRRRAAVSSAAASSSSAAPTSSSPTPTGPLPLFPFVVKLEERRIPNSAAAVQPYCQKMIIPIDGDPVPMTDDDGNPVRINIIEHDPSPSDFSTAFNPKKSQAAATSTSSPRRREERDLRQFFRRNDPSKSCHCLWVSPLGPY